MGNKLFPAEFQHVVGVVHEVLRVFDGDDGMARIGEPVDKRKQVLDVFLVQAARRLVEEEQRVGRFCTGERDGKAQAGAFASGEVCGGLPESQVSKPRVGKWF